MFGMSIEHMLVLFVVLLIFGPKRLPELGGTLGQFIRNFKDSVNGIEESSFKKIEPLEQLSTHKSNSLDPNQSSNTQPSSNTPQS